MQDGSFEKNSSLWSVSGSGSGSQDWQRLQLPLVFPAGASQAEVQLQLNATGTVWFDSIQLERAYSATRFNLLENNSFESDTSYWGSANTEAGDGRSTEAAGFGNASLKINGKVGLNKNFYQTIYISGNAGDTLVFGGWAKGQSLPLKAGRYL